jgi:hypothetical protein
VLVTLFLAAPDAVADGAPGAVEAPPERRLVLRSTAEVALLARGGSLGYGDGLAGVLPLHAPGPHALRPDARPFRAWETIPSQGDLRGGAPLYGVLAGRALLSALALHGDLPGHATPWFDGDADRMIAGVEFSF